MWAQESNQDSENQEIYDKVDIVPQFPGGNQAMYKFIAESIKYPEAAQRANVTGIVIAKFVVDRNGNLLNPLIMKGIGFGCDAEVIRVIKSMPQWTPGIKDGKPVNTWFSLPVTYMLGKSKRKRNSSKG